MKLEQWQIDHLDAWLENAFWSPDLAPMRAAVRERIEAYLERRGGSRLSVPVGGDPAARRPARRRGAVVSTIYCIARIDDHGREQVAFAYCDAVYRLFEAIPAARRPATLFSVEHAIDVIHRVGGEPVRIVPLHEAVRDGIVHHFDAGAHRYLVITPMRVINALRASPFIVRECGYLSDAGASS
jgi:hypothetical protein